METHLAEKIRTLTGNHDELTRLINGEQFGRFDADTQARLLALHDLLDTKMREISQRVDALDRQVADVFLSLGL